MSYSIVIDYGHYIEFSAEPPLGLLKHPMLMKLTVVAFYDYCFDMYNKCFQKFNG